MIGRIKGILLEKQAPELLVDVGGVAYELQAPMTTCFQLPEVGASVTLHTHFAVSESAQQLFGFISRRDRDLFRLLIKVNGVGPKMAVAILSLDADELVACVRDDNVTALTRVPGVGKKTAERLIVDLRDRLKAWSGAESGVAPEPAAGVSGMPSKNALLAEAESALVALGYKPVEASKAVSRAYSDETGSAEELIRDALKSMLP